MTDDYGKILDSALSQKQQILLRSDISNYEGDCIEVICHLCALKKNIVVITFGGNTRDISEILEYRKADISRVYYIDAISISQGKGTPPVKKVVTVYKPNSFEDINLYTMVFVRDLGIENTVVVFLSIHKLQEYENEDEIGFFLYYYTDQLKRLKVPKIILTHSGINYVLAQIISRNADIVIPVRKEKMVA